MEQVYVVTNRPRENRGLVIVTEDGGVHPLPYSPKTWNYKDNHRWGTAEREGGKAIARRRGSGLRTLDFTITVASPDYNESIEHKIRHITGWAARGNVFRIKNGSANYQGSCWWYLKDMDLSVERVTVFGEASQATLKFSMEEYTDAISAVIKPPPPPPPPPPPIQTPAPNPTPVKQPVYRYHTTVRGDTLYQIAYKYLRSCYKWRTIYDLNKTIIGSNPCRLAVGLKLKIPPA